MALNPHPRLAAFGFQQWVDEHRHLLQPPVCNQLLHHESGMIGATCC
jgi:3-hydroxyanthranilate 3,4-dioxygenase